MISSYAKLPESLNETELAPHFDQLIASLPDGQATDKARDLLELVLRQANTGAELDPDRSRQISDWVVSKWQPADESLTDHLLGSIVNLNLQACLPLLDSALADPATPEASRELIESARREM